MQHSCVDQASGPAWLEGLHSSNITRLDSGKHSVVGHLGVHGLLNQVLQVLWVPIHKRQEQCFSAWHPKLLNNAKVCTLSPVKAL